MVDPVFCIASCAIASRIWANVTIQERRFGAVQAVSVATSSCKDSSAVPIPQWLVESTAVQLALFTVVHGSERSLFVHERSDA